MADIDLDLTLEQRALLAQFAYEAEQLSEAQLKERLLISCQMLMQKENVIKTLSHWKANGCTEVPPPTPSR